ncbi:MAG TPA: PAS domain-containing protein [Methanocella sp.]|jgi:PAS domain S-box-containing protein
MLVENINHQESRISPDTLEVYELLCVPVLAVDTGFNIIFINEKACEMTGYSKEDIRNKKLFDIAAPGELKKKLLRLFQGQVFERDFTVRSTLMTRNGRIRNIEWQCRTMFQGIFRAGAVITFVDLTGAETVLDMARIMAGSVNLEYLACGFMDLLSDPLNLKLARVIIDTGERQTLAFFRAYPSGAVHKKPRLALHDSYDVSLQTDIYTFPLRTEGRSIGSLELTPYGGSQLTSEDDSYVRRLCNVFSSGIERMIVVPPVGEIPSGAKNESSTSGLEKPSPETTAVPVKGTDMAGHLMSMLPQGVIICGRDGKVTTINESVVRIFDIPRSELEGQHINDIIRRLAPERENGVAIGSRNLAISRALRTGNPVMNAHYFIQVKGSRRELVVCAIPVRDAAGDIAGCMATVRDITVITSIVRTGHMALNVASIDDLIEESLDLIMNAMSLRLASLYLWDGSQLKLKVQKGDNSGMPVTECMDVPDYLSPTLQSRTFLRGKPLLIKNYRRCASVRLFDPLACKRPVRSIAGVPLLADNNVIGVLIAATGEGHPMDEVQLAELSTLCSQMAAGIGRACPRKAQG